MEVAGSVARTVTWYVDDRLIAVKKSAENTVHVKPGDRLGKGVPTGDADAWEQPDADALTVKFGAFGRIKRVTWYRAQGTLSATACAVLGRGGIDLDPAPGSSAALREERARRHPGRYAALAVAGGVMKVVAPVLLGLVAVRLTLAIPWPDWDAPSLPAPDIDLPSFPTPHVDFPDWQLPGWVAWLAEKVKYVWPILLAWVLARREIRRRREQDALKARLKADLGGDDSRTESSPDPSRTSGPQLRRDENATAAE